MKTTHYNPSSLEVAMAEAIVGIQQELESKIPDYKIAEVDADLKADNPVVKFQVIDKDNDRHQLVLRVIQSADSLD